MSTYRGVDSIALAQAELDRHVTSSVDGVCLACGVSGPCDARERAARLFRSSLRFPRRRPGATRPEWLALGGSAQRVCAVRAEAVAERRVQSTARAGDVVYVGPTATPPFSLRNGFRFRVIRLPPAALPPMRQR